MAANVSHNMTACFLHLWLPCGQHVCTCCVVMMSSGCKHCRFSNHSDCKSWVAVAELPAAPDILLHHAVPTRSCRVAWLLEELNLPYKTQLVDFPTETRSAGYRQCNVAGMCVPRSLPQQLALHSCSAHCAGCSFGVSTCRSWFAYVCSTRADCFCSCVHLPGLTSFVAEQDSVHGGR